MLRILGLMAVVVTVLFIGKMAAAVVAMLLGIVGLPGRLLATVQKGENAFTLITGVLITVICQSYATLIFSALVIESTRVVVGNSTGFWMWIFWIVAIWVASGPGVMAARSVADHEYKPDNPLEYIDMVSITCTAAINTIGSIVFAIFPSVVAWGWGWVPHIREIK